MTDSQVQRHLKAADLYDKIVAVADHDASVCQVTFDETKLRGLLDAVYNAGLIDGRLTALGELPPQLEWGRVWQDRQNPEAKIELYGVSHRGIVSYTKTTYCCDRDWCKANGHAMQAGMRNFLAKYQPSSPQDQLIEGWQRIVDSVQ